MAITGVGLATPLGLGTDESWAGLIEGRTALGRISSYDPASLHTQVGAEIGEFRPRDYVEQRRSLRTMTRHDLMNTVAAVLAVRDAGLEFEDDVDARHAVFAASGKETSVPENFTDVALAVRGGDGIVDAVRFGEIAMGGVPPLFFLEGLQGASLHYLSEAFTFRGANTYFAGTAEAGMHAIGRGFRAVRRGEADIALAGGGDAPVGWWNMSKIDELGILTRQNDRDAGACRPFDKDRDGTAMGEGGAYLLMEDLESAQARGAHIHAELVGYGFAGDVGHYLLPDPSGAPIAAALNGALRDAGAAASEVGYVAAHGSGTVAGDAAEAAGIRSALGGGAAVSSVKAATGNLVAAAGALNAAVATLAIARGEIPPTVNLDAVDPSCEGVDWVTGTGRQANVGLALAVARGLEGQIVALAMRGA